MRSITLAQPQRITLSALWVTVSRSNVLTDRTVDKETKSRMIYRPDRESLIVVRRSKPCCQHLVAGLLKKSLLMLTALLSTWATRAHTHAYRTHAIYLSRTHIPRDTLSFVRAETRVKVSAQKWYQVQAERSRYHFHAFLAYPAAGKQDQGWSIRIAVLRDPRRSLQVLSTAYSRIHYSGMFYFLVASQRLLTNTIAFQTFIAELTLLIAQ